MRALAAALAVLMVGLVIACRNPFGRHYEYEEQMYLNVDGSATITINASIPALIALRGLPLDASMDRDAMRAVVERAGCESPRVGRPWTRHGRRFAQIRLAVDDVTRFASCGLLAWSTYRFAIDAGVVHYQQTVGPAAGGDPGAVNWEGGEIVGFKLHLPSRILFHNVKRLEDGSNGSPERGNILAWEQYLSDRRAGRPLDMEVRMDAQSILFHAVRLFLGALLAAIAVLAGIVWFVVRRGRRRSYEPPPASRMS
jgi:hypothetical protein